MKMKCSFCKKSYLFKGHGATYDTHTIKCQEHFKMCRVDLDQMNLKKSQIEILVSQSTQATNKQAEEITGHGEKSKHPLMKKSKINVQCEICREAYFNRKDLFLHLYRKHINLKKQIHKSVVANFSDPTPFYTLEKKNMHCFCPICDKEMKATRTQVGIHWAVEHEQIKPIYLSYLKERRLKSKTEKKKSEMADSSDSSSDFLVRDGEIEDHMRKLEHENHTIKEENKKNNQLDPYKGNHIMSGDEEEEYDCPKIAITDTRTLTGTEFEGEISKNVTDLQEIMTEEDKSNLRLERCFVVDELSADHERLVIKEECATDQEMLVHKEES